MKTTGGTDISWPGASISANAASEAWTELLVVIPSGVTSMQVGVNWNTVTTNEIMYINEVEVNKLSSGTPEYQYHLKDHLGNVRTTFTAKTLTTTNYATDFESGSNSNFLNYSNTGFDLVDHTDPGGNTYTNVQWLNGGVNGRTGLAKTFAVMPGDEITISAWCKYMNLNTDTNPNAFITSLAAAFGVSSTSTGEQLKAYDGLNGFVGSASGGAWGRNNETVPKAFATILFFDKDFNLVDAAWDQVTSTGAQSSPSVKQPPHDLVSVTKKAPAAGYAFVFLSNEHPFYVDVYFDDVTVSVTPSMVVQVQDYYPFGLTSISASRENSLRSMDKLGGFEIQDELDFGWIDFGARLFMADLDRWNRVDNYAGTYMSLSPFHYAGNNPIMFMDVNGDYFTGDVGQAEKVRDRAREGVKESTDQIANALTNIVKALESGDKKALKGSVDKLNSAAENREGFRETIKEFNEMKFSSDQEYKIQYSAGKKGGETSWDRNSKALVMEVNGDIEVTAHELKHGSQFESGTMSFQAADSYMHTFYDLGDEVEAYKRQYLFNPKSLPNPLDNALGISEMNVRQILNEDKTGYAYDRGIPMSQTNFLPPYLDSNVADGACRRIANNSGIAFRSNGKTYYPNKP